ncbi:hypothetical protein GQ55_1G301200 [Panicum hallii var. hallii]|uniref:Leucine-rich repeat-containing N-terminal plant-type domain-containing protein n=1 Tax=Panicum hallii var. hallii TaxID=1504633 RepID=A0A2T7F926_9POAL|nr:hypothetical protein GQ55_1G301200 [Panicum hallii var. hallii]
MASHPKCHLTQNLLFILSYTAAIVAASTPQTYYNQQYTPTDYPMPHDFPNDSLYQAYLVIQRFKKTITCDPMNITSTWTGHDICGATTYVGFYCTTLPGHGKNVTAVTSAVFDGFGLCAPQLQGFIDQLPDLALFLATSNKFDALGVLNLAGLTYHYKVGISDDPAAQPFSDAPRIDFRKSYGCDLGGIVCTGFMGGIGIHRRHSLSLEAIPGATNTRVLLLNNDELSGSLPENLGFSKLSYLAVANNKLTGPIPPSIGHLQDSLLVLLLLNNQLSGCLPHELGMLNNAAVINAGMNRLTGPIPSSFSCLSSVELLNLAGNRLYGPVPDALCKLAGPAGRLANLTLSGNYFTSVGPACAALIRDGVLDVKSNCIPGLANQRRPAECAAFQSQPKTCPAASNQQVACPAAAAAKGAAAPGERKARDYSSYVTYATLHE